MQKSIIQAVTNDIYEFPIIQFDSYKEMAKYLGLSKKHCHCLVSRGTIYRKLNCKFIKISLEELDNEIEENKSL